MTKYLNLRANIALGLIIAFLLNSLGPVPTAQADDFRLPAPGVMVPLSPEFNPPILKGIKVHPDDPFRFDFILDKGDSSVIPAQAGIQKLIKYFLASLTIPEKDLWVNLSPYEKNRIVPESFGQTEMGRDLLAEDYMLKQITASLIYPEGETGKEFWKRIYEEAAKKFGTTNIPVNTFNKVWIVPDKAVIYENAKVGTAYVIQAKLKVMLERDYLSMSKHADIGVPNRIQDPDIDSIGSQVIRSIVIPELTKEVNEGKNFAQLRQVFSSLILATWYKKKIRDSILERVYAGKNKVSGIVLLRGSETTEAIYQQYLRAFKKGVYNYIKEEQDPITRQPIPRKYFSGGAELTHVPLDFAMESQVAALSPSHLMDLNVKIAELSQPMRPPDITRRQMVREGYSFLIRPIADGDAPRSMSVTLFLNGEVIDDVDISFDIFDAQKIVYITTFFPQFPKPESDEKKVGRGRALLREVLKKLKVQGYYILANASDEFLSSLNQMHDTHPQIAGSKESLYRVDKDYQRLADNILDNSKGKLKRKYRDYLDEILKGANFIGQVPGNVVHLRAVEASMARHHDQAMEADDEVIDVTPDPFIMKLITENGHEIDFQGAHTYQDIIRGFSKEEVRGFDGSSFSSVVDAIRDDQRSGEWRDYHPDGSKELKRQYYILPGEKIFGPGGALEKNGFYKRKYFKKILRQFLLETETSSGKKVPITLDFKAQPGSAEYDSLQRAQFLIKDIIRVTSDKFLHGKLSINQIPVSQWRRWYLRSLRIGSPMATRAAIATGIRLGLAGGFATGMLSSIFTRSWVPVIVGMVTGAMFGLAIAGSLVIRERLTYKEEHAYEKLLELYFADKTMEDVRANRKRVHDSIDQMHQALVDVDEGRGIQGRQNKQMLDKVSGYIFKGLPDYREYIWAMEVGREFILHQIPDMTTRKICIAMLRELADMNPEYFEGLVRGWKREVFINNLVPSWLRTDQPEKSLPELFLEMVPVIRRLLHDEQRNKLAREKAATEMDTKKGDFTAEDEFQWQYRKLRTTDRLEFVHYFINNLKKTLVQLPDPEDRKTAVEIYFLSGGARLRLVLTETNPGGKMDPNYSRSLLQAFDKIWLQELDQIQKEGQFGDLEPILKILRGYHEELVAKGFISPVNGTGPVEVDRAMKGEKKDSAMRAGPALKGLALSALLFTGDVLPAFAEIPFAQSIEVANYQETIDQLRENIETHGDADSLKKLIEMSNNGDGPDAKSALVALQQLDPRNVTDPQLLIQLSGSGNPFAEDIRKGLYKGRIDRGDYKAAIDYVLIFNMGDNNDPYRVKSADLIVKEIQQHGLTDDDLKDWGFNLKEYPNDAVILKVAIAIAYQGDYLTASELFRLKIPGLDWNRIYSRMSKADVKLLRSEMAGSMTSQVVQKSHTSMKIIKDRVKRGESFRVIFDSLEVSDWVNLFKSNDSQEWVSEVYKIAPHDTDALAFLASIGKADPNLMRRAPQPTRAILQSIRRKSFRNYTGNWPGVFDLMAAYAQAGYDFNALMIDYLQTDPHSAERLIDLVGDSHPLNQYFARLDYPGIEKYLSSPDQKYFLSLKMLLDKHADAQAYLVPLLEQNPSLITNLWSLYANGYYEKPTVAGEMYEDLSIPSTKGNDQIGEILLTLRISPTFLLEDFTPPIGSPKGDTLYHLLTLGTLGNQSAFRLLLKLGMQDPSVSEKLRTMAIDIPSNIRFAAQQMDLTSYRKNDDLMRMFAILGHPEAIQYMAQEAPEDPFVSLYTQNVRDFNSPEFESLAVSAQRYISQLRSDGIGKLKQRLQTANAKDSNKIILDIYLSVLIDIQARMGVLSPSAFNKIKNDMVTKVNMSINVFNANSGGEFGYRLILALHDIDQLFEVAGHEIGHNILFNSTFIYGADHGLAVIHEFFSDLVGYSFVGNSAVVEKSLIFFPENGVQDIIKQSQEHGSQSIQIDEKAEPHVVGRQAQQLFIELAKANNINGPEILAHLYLNHPDLISFYKGSFLDHKEFIIYAFARGLGLKDYPYDPSKPLADCIRDLFDYIKKKQHADVSPAGASPIVDRAMRAQVMETNAAGETGHYSFALISKKPDGSVAPLAEADRITDPDFLAHLQTLSQRVRDILALIPEHTAIAEDKRVKIPRYFDVENDIDSSYGLYFSRTFRSPALIPSNLKAKLESIMSGKSESEGRADIDQYLEASSEFLVHEYGHIIDRNGGIIISEAKKKLLADEEARLLKKYRFNAEEQEYILRRKSDLRAEVYRASQHAHLSAYPRWMYLVKIKPNEGRPHRFTSSRVLRISLAQWYVFFVKNGQTELSQRITDHFRSVLLGEDREFFDDMVKFFSLYFDAYQYDPAWLSRVQKTDGAMKAGPGGIDLTPANMNLQTQNSNGEIKFHIDSAQLAQFQNAPGFVPVIISMQPLVDLHQFLDK